MTRKRSVLEEACLKLLRGKVGPRGASAVEIDELLPRAESPAPGHDRDVHTVLERLVAEGEVYRRLKRANGVENWVYIFNNDMVEPSREAMTNVTYGMLVLQTLVDGYDVCNMWGDITGHLARLEAAVRELMAIRAQLYEAEVRRCATEEDLNQLKRLSELVATWRAGGKVSPEIARLARRLMDPINGLIWAVERAP